MKPKEQFLKSAHREPLERWNTTASADAARDAALLEFVAELDRPSDPSKSWDQGCALYGAKRILDILFSLHMKEDEKQVVKLGHLKPPS